ncbi:MAG: serine hydrolase domain-containing protein [Bacteroidota bacterium]
MKYLFIATIIILSCTQCTMEETTIPQELNACTSEFENHQMHPKAEQYQAILERNQKRNIVGMTMLIKDRHGVWSGASGMADLQTKRPMRACDRMAIASISKPFTAVVIMRLIEDDLLTLESEVKNYVSDEIVKKVANVDQAKIEHLLSHRSGIPDYYTTGFLFDQVNTNGRITEFQGFLEYVYGKSADFEVGETYGYSNNNYVLLGMIAEEVTGKLLNDLYQQYIFDPLNLSSAYFDVETPFPSDMPNAYVDLYGNNNLVDARFLYGDEGGTPDGGIIIHNLDLLRFFEALSKGELVSDASLNVMTDWFELPEDWRDDEVLGQLKNGYGLEHFENEYGYALGHTGGIDGFLSLAFYFPEQDYIYIQAINTVDYDLEGRIDAYTESLEVIFEE